MMIWQLSMSIVNSSRETQFQYTFVFYVCLHSASSPGPSLSNKMSDAVMSWILLLCLGSPPWHGCALCQGVLGKESYRTDMGNVGGGGWFGLGLFQVKKDEEETHVPPSAEPPAKRARGDLGASHTWREEEFCVADCILENTDS